MGYYIYASLLDGKPNLKIVDADSQKTCMQWHCEKLGQDNSEEQHEIQRLFRQLLLLSCKQNLSNSL